MSGQVAYLTQTLGANAPLPHPGHGPDATGRFERMVQRHHARLRRLAASALDNSDRVDDVMQEAYLKAYRHLPRGFESESHEANWLIKIVFRCCLDELRSRSRRRRRENLDEDVESLPAESRSMRMPVDRAFRSLSNEDRSLLLLVDLVGFEYPDVAHLLDVPRGTVASRLNAARRRFRDALVREGDRDAGSG